MNNVDNEVFEFGVKQDENTDSFNYENLSGLGESNYENEDLFDSVPSEPTTTVEMPNEAPLENNWDINNYSYDLNSDKSLNDVPDSSKLVDKKFSLVDLFGAEPVNFDTLNIDDDDDDTTTGGVTNEIPVIEQPTVESVFNPEPIVTETVQEPTVEEITTDPFKAEDTPVVEPIAVDTMFTPEQNSNTTTVDFDLAKEEQPKNEEIFYTGEEAKEPELKPVEEVNNSYTSNNDTPDIPMSETPIDELQKLTEYEEEEIDATDINSLFEKLSLNVKDASEIFKKNTTLKQKIDSRFEELKSLQSELTNSRKKQIEEIDQYKDEVLEKLTEKKEEIEKRLNTLKELQAKLEKEKTEFEEYKRKEQANISKVQKQIQSAYDERREELEHIESVLRKQKDSLDEERNQLSLDKIQYESDKNDLANSLLKFNQIVDSFTNGIDMKNEE